MERRTLWYVFTFALHIIAHSKVSAAYYRTRTSRNGKLEYEYGDPKQTYEKRNADGCIENEGKQEVERCIESADEVHKELLDPDYGVNVFNPFTQAFGQTSLGQSTQQYDQTNTAQTPEKVLLVPRKHSTIFFSGNLNAKML